MSERRLKIGFCGAGKVVKNMHVPTLLNMTDRYEIMGFVDLDRDKAAEACGQAGAGDAYTSIAEMKAAHPELDVVTVATAPYTTHAPLAIEALEAGCHVQVEKPFTVSLAEAQRMFEAADRCGRSLVAYQNRRYEVAFLAFKQAIDEGVLGELRYVQRRMTCSNEPHDLLNFGSHIIDQIICLSRGEAPAELTATIGNPDVEYDGPAGYFKLCLRYASGLIADVEMLPNTEHISYFYAAGTEGSLRQDWADNMADLFRKQWSLDCPNPKWLPTGFNDLFPNILRQDGYLFHLTYDRLYRHLVDGAPPPVEPRDTLLQFAIIEAMFRSARGKRAVPLAMP